MKRISDHLCRLENLIWPFVFAAGFVLLAMLENGCSAPAVKSAPTIPPAPRYGSPEYVTWYYTYVGNSSGLGYEPVQPKVTEAGRKFQEAGEQLSTDLRSFTGALRAVRGAAMEVQRESDSYIGENYDRYRQPPQRSPYRDDYRYGR